MDDDKKHNKDFQAELVSIILKTDKFFIKSEIYDPYEDDDEAYGCDLLASYAEYFARLFSHSHQFQLVTEPVKVSISAIDLMCKLCNDDRLGSIDIYVFEELWNLRKSTLEWVLSLLDIATVANYRKYESALIFV